MALFKVSFFLALVATALCSLEEIPEDEWTDIPITNPKETSRAVMSASRLIVARGAKCVDAALIADPVLAGANAALTSDSMPVILPLNVQYITDCVMYGMSGGFHKQGEVYDTVSASAITMDFSLGNNKEIGLLCDYEITLFSGKLRLRLSDAVADVTLTQSVGLTPVIALQGVEAYSTNLELQVTGYGMFNFIGDYHFQELVDTMRPAFKRYIDDAVSAAFRSSLA